MEQFISQLDCQRFGFKVAKIFSWDEIDIKQTIEGLRALGVKLLITKVNSDRFSLINTLEELGFRIKDTQVTYRHDISKVNFANVALNPDAEMREATERDIENLVAIASESFMGYGHYFADERLDRDCCGEIYPDWVRRSCIDPVFSDKVFVVTVNNKVAGFLSFKIKEKDAQKYAAGGIGAVAKDYRKDGIFAALAKQGLIWGVENGLIWEEHNVLTTNYAVNRVFAKCGFGVVNSFMTLHNWLD